MSGATAEGHPAVPASAAAIEEQPTAQSQRRRGRRGAGDGDAEAQGTGTQRRRGRGGVLSAGAKQCRIDVEGTCSRLADASLCVPCDSATLSWLLQCSGASARDGCSTVSGSGTLARHSCRDTRVLNAPLRRHQTHNRPRREPTRPAETSVCCTRCGNSSRGGTRTPDRVINSHLLYHLSYPGITLWAVAPEPLNFTAPLPQVKRG